MSKTKWKPCDDPEVLAAAVAAGVKVRGGYGPAWPSSMVRARDFTECIEAGTRYWLPADWKPTPEPPADDEPCATNPCEACRDRIERAEPPADESDPPEVTRRTRREVTDDFIEGTRTIREWVNGGGVNGPRLCEELDAWLDYWGGSPVTPAPPVPPCEDDENDDIARLSEGQGDRIINACCRILGCEPADIDGDAAYEEILTEAVERAAVHVAEQAIPAPPAPPWPGDDDWREAVLNDLNSIIHQHCGSDGSDDAHCDWVNDLANEVVRYFRRPDVAFPSPVPPWPGAVLSGLVDEDGQPTWLAQAPNVQGEAVRTCVGFPSP